MANYDSLHRQCRTLESLFDAKLTSYARLAASISRAGTDDDLEAGPSWREAESEVADLLEKLGETNAALGAVAQDTDNPPSQSMLRAIQRHRDVYQDYGREFRRTKGNVQAAVDHANLLSGVRNDIDAYKSSASEALLVERGRIDSSHQMMDDTLDQARETRAEFGRQRSSLGAIQTRMVGVLNTVPGINDILSMIHNRRRRDTYIIGGLIGICLFFLLRYMFW
ncbi:v-SNARE protein [Russula ochroleuca]|jgi:Golgi SNAP receptor complex protein 1|uniref:Golgi SNAP receptor complex member 1 n=1 Tax=Russula ochroleuca TaxID=152965 RepID=A0A9P5TAS6_9AGAM|nr:v-SNARE protein [Russula ochroleuca]